MPSGVMFMVLAVLVFSEGWLMGNPTLSGLSASNNYLPTVFPWTRRDVQEEGGLENLEPV